MGLQILEVKGIRVLTSAQIASCYETTRDCIKKNFCLNKSRFIEGKHYIALVGDELRTFKNEVTNSNLLEIGLQNEVRVSHPVTDKARYQLDTQFKYAKSLYLWTEKGALLHAKSLNTDKAWEVYDYLVDFYFRAKKTEDSDQASGKPSEKLPAKAEKASCEFPDGTDIAPEFRRIISHMPLEALDAMEQAFRKSNDYVVTLASLDVLAEKMKRRIS